LTDKTKVTIAKWASAAIGIFAFFTSFLAEGIFDIVKLVWAFYTPLVVIPILLALLGFRSTVHSFMFATATSFLIIVYLKFFTEYDAVLWGMAIYVGLFLGFHYLFKQEGGWVGIKHTMHKMHLKTMQEVDKLRLRKFFRNFSPWEYWYKRLPQNKWAYPFLGVVSSFITIYLMQGVPDDQWNQYHELILAITITGIFIGVGFLSSFFWVEEFVDSELMGMLWYVACLYTFGYSPCVYYLISKMSYEASLTYAVTLTATILLFPWGTGIAMAWIGYFLGTMSVASFSRATKGVDIEALDIGASKPSMIFSLLIITVFAASYLRYIQNHNQKKIREEQRTRELREDNIKTYAELRPARLLIKFFDVEQHLLIRKIQESFKHVPYLKNVDEEYWDILNGGLQRSYQNTENIALLHNFINEIIVMRKAEVNFVVILKDLVKDFEEKFIKKEHIWRVKQYSDLNLQLEIDPRAESVTIMGDVALLKLAIMRVIENAIVYTEKGNVKITLTFNGLESRPPAPEVPVRRKSFRKKKIPAQTPYGGFKIIIEDDGIGIPPEELEDIFYYFATSSKTYTPAGGRGLGLPLARVIAQAHNMTLRAYSNGEKGSTFIFSEQILWED